MFGNTISNKSKIRKETGAKLIKKIFSNTGSSQNSMPIEYLLLSSEISYQMVDLFYLLSRVAFYHSTQDCKNSMFLFKK